MVSNWFKANGFLLNDSKTQSILFCLKITQSESNTDNLKLLAVYFDQKLSWEHHIKHISGRLSRVIYLIENLKNYVGGKYIGFAYFAFFRSIISYGILLWGNSSHVDSILLLQKKLVRIITGANRLDHCKPLFIQLKVMTVVRLYIYTQLFCTL